jgi:hypothetical protein
VKSLQCQVEVLQHKMAASTLELQSQAASAQAALEGTSRRLQKAESHKEIMCACVHPWWILYVALFIYSIYAVMLQLT